MELELGRQLKRTEHIDHIDGNPLNNRVENLRLASHKQNLRNQQVQRRPKSSRYKGVLWDKSIRMWRATIKVDGKKVYLGCSKDENVAVRLYNEGALKYFGEFAYLNGDLKCL